MSNPSDNPSSIDLLHLLVRTTHTLQRELEARLTTYPIPFPISAPRLRVLATVSDVGSIRMKDLAERLNIKARTVTDFVDALERERLLARVPDPSDGRATLIQLTELARNHLDEVLVYQTRVADGLLADMSDEEHAILFHLLSKLVLNRDTSDLSGPASGI